MALRPLVAPAAGSVAEAALSKSLRFCTEAYGTFCTELLEAVDLADFSEAVPALPAPPSQAHPKSAFGAFGPGGAGERRRDLHRGQLAAMAAAKELQGAAETTPGREAHPIRPTTYLIIYILVLYY